MPQTQKALRLQPLRSALIRHPPNPSLPAAPPWDAEAVAAGVAQTRFANRIHHLPTVTSTSTLALEAAQSGSPEGHVWVADEQTAGRGRGGHTWHSEPRAGLYLSALLRPTLPPAQALHLSLATGLAVQAAATELTGRQPDLRWPNDLLLDGRKFGESWSKPPSAHPPEISATRSSASAST